MSLEEAAKKANQANTELFNKGAEQIQKNTERVFHVEQAVETINNSILELISSLHILNDQTKKIRERVTLLERAAIELSKKCSEQPEEEENNQTQDNQGWDLPIEELKKAFF